MVTFGTREEYHKKTNKKHIFTENNCPFCKPKEQKGHTLWEGQYWYILHNIYPYSGNNQHLMAVPYTHRKYSHELSGEEFSELKSVQNFVKDFYKQEHYFSATRESMGNRSVEHMHIHFLPGKLQGKYLRKMLQNQGFPIDADLE